MGTVLPNGYGLWKPTFTLDGSTKIFQSAFMFRNATSGTAAASGAAIRGYWQGAGRPFIATNIFIGYTMARSETYVMLGGVLTYDLNSNPIVGTKAGSLGTPINTSIIIKKDTGIVGKRYRGRSMLPNLMTPEANISQAGVIDTAGLTALQTSYSDLFTAWSAGSWPPYLGHSVSEVAPTALTSFTVNPLVGSMPHRIRGF